MKDIINNLKTSDDTDEEHEMHSKSDNVEIIIYEEADEVIEELFKTLLNRCKIGLETSVRGSDFIFETWWFIYRFS